jgi:hypothetical protein
MGARDDLKAELASLISEGAELTSVLKGENVYVEFTSRYQVWYTKAIKILSALAPDRVAEFRSYYEADPKRKSFDYGTYMIQDYVKALGAPQNYSTGKPQWDVVQTVGIRLYAQRTILASLSSRIDGVLANIETTLASELEDTTLDAARRLMQVNLRAAGTLAGVVLEEHLQRVAKDRKLKVKASPTVSDLNEPLRQAGAYDVPTWRRIQHLADLRNLCAHKKAADPTKDQVTQLIDGVNWTVKTVV